MDRHVSEADVRALLLHPALFNFVLLGLYLCAAIRWAYAREWWQSLYWLSACGITSAITFGGP